MPSSQGSNLLCSGMIRDSATDLDHWPHMHAGMRSFPKIQTTKFLWCCGSGLAHRSLLPLSLAVHQCFRLVGSCMWFSWLRLSSDASAACIYRTVLRLHVHASEMQSELLSFHSFLLFQMDQTNKSIGHVIIIIKSRFDHHIRMEGMEGIRKTRTKYCTVAGEQNICSQITRATFRNI